jgi:hypothetical protein
MIELSDFMVEEKAYIIEDEDDSRESGEFICSPIAYTITSGSLHFCE